MQGISLRVHGKSPIYTLSPEGEDRVVLEEIKAISILDYILPVYSVVTSGLFVPSGKFSKAHEIS